MQLRKQLKLQQSKYIKETKKINQSKIHWMNKLPVKYQFEQILF